MSEPIVRVMSVRPRLILEAPRGMEGRTVRINRFAVNGGDDSVILPESQRRDAVLGAAEREGRNRAVYSARWAE